MSVGIVHVTFLAAALFGAGLYGVLAGGARRSAFGVVALASAVAVELAGVSRLAASTRDPLSGQAFAALIVIAAPLLVALLYHLGDENVSS